MPVAGLLHAAERQVRLGADGGGVDVRDAVVELVERAEREVHVLRVDRTREPVLHAVIHAERLVGVLHADHREHRTEDLLLLDAHAGLHAREDGRLEEEALLETTAVRALPAECELRALGETDLDVALDLRDGIGVDHRAHIRAGLTPIAQLERLRALDELGHERIVHAVLHDQAARGCAALPRGAERAPEYAVEREFEVGVVEHGLRVLAAHLKRQTLVHASAGLTHLAARLGGAGERHERHVGVIHNRRAHFTIAVDELDHLGRKPRLEQDLHEHMAGVRHIFGGLEHAGVPADQRREHLPRGDCEREVERRDDAGHTDRPTETHRPLGAQLAGHRVPEQATPFGGRVVRRVDAFLHITARLGQRLAHLAGHEVRELFLTRHQDVAHAAQHVTARRRRSALPTLEAALGGLDGLGHIGRAGLGETAHEVRGVRGVHIFEIGTGRGRDPLAGDEVLESGHGAKDSGRRKTESGRRRTTPRSPRSRGGRPRGSRIPCAATHR